MLRYVVIGWMVMLASGQLRGTLRSHYVRRLFFFKSYAKDLHSYIQLQRGHPADRIVLLEESEPSASSLGDDVNAALSKIDQQLSKATEMLDEELSQSRQDSSEDTKVISSNRTEESPNWTPNPEFEARLERCLDLIRGGKGAVAEHLDTALRSVPKLEDVCPLLKRLHFPRLAAHGFDSPVYNTLENRPPLDGSVPMYFDAAKHEVFNCLCQFQVIPRSATV